MRAEESVQEGSGELGRLLAQRILDLERQFPRPSDCPQGDDALLRLLGAAYRPSGEEGVRRHRGATPLRGEVWPMVVDDVDLPPPGSLPVEISHFSARVRRAFRNAAKVMFRDALLEEAGEASWIRQLASPDPVTDCKFVNED